MPSRPRPKVSLPKKPTIKKPARLAIKKPVSSLKKIPRPPKLATRNAIKAAPARLSGLPRELVNLAKPLLSRRSPVLSLLKEEGLTPQLPLRLAKALETILRQKMPAFQAQTLADLVYEAKNQKILSEEGFHLATRLRHLRNAFAHDAVVTNTAKARTLLAVSTAILLFSELEK